LTTGSTLAADLTLASLVLGEVSGYVVEFGAVSELRESFLLLRVLLALPGDCQ